MQTEDWYLKAVCRGCDTNIFYQELAKGSDMKYKEARRMCANCPVLDECKKSAIEEEAMCAIGPYGMRAGLLPKERARLIKAFRAEQRKKLELHNLRKPVCIRGHIQIPKNRYEPKTKTGARGCILCHREQSRIQKRRRRAS